MSNKNECLFGLGVTAQEIAHYNFIEATDRKSLHTQIKGLVNVAKELALDDLKLRRTKLKKMLEHEDQKYEEEFASQVKSRIDMDIQKRNQKLIQIKEQSTKKAEVLIKQKRIQQFMESCYEVRDMLRQKETRNVKETHLEQMLQKERSIAHERKLDKYWLDVGKLNQERAKEQQCEESCLKRRMAMDNKRILEDQMQEQQALKDLLVTEKRREAEEVNRVINEIRIEEFDRKHHVKSTKVLEYRNDLLQMIEEQRLRKVSERNEAADWQRQLIKEIQAAEAEEIVALGERKRANYRALVDFIKYSRSMRGLTDSQHKLREDRIDDLHRVDVCTKNNLQFERAKRARIAEECYAQLRKQVYEQTERRLREELERRENKILENRFVHEEIPPQIELERRRKYREDLDKQIVEMKRIRLEEEEKYHSMLLRASNDSEFCEELAAEYLRAGTAYLEPHPNWKILLCPGEVYDPKPKALTEPVKCPACFGCAGKHNNKCNFSI